jgi:hypothetical protein
MNVSAVGASKAEEMAMKQMHARGWAVALEKTKSNCGADQIAMAVAS